MVDDRGDDFSSDELSYQSRMHESFLYFLEHNRTRDDVFKNISQKVHI
jgi:hypothetical protein